MTEKIEDMDERGSFAAQWIGQVRKALAAGVAARIREQGEELVTQAGDTGFPDVIADTETRLEFLCEALAAGRVGLFADHLRWLKIAYARRDLPVDYVTEQARAIRDELREALPAPHGELAVGLVDAALQDLDAAPTVSNTLLADDAPHVDLARRYLLAVLEGRRVAAELLIAEALAAGVPPEELETHVLVRTQQELGRMWQVGEVHSAEEHFATRLAERLVGRLFDARQRAPRRGLRVVVASVPGNDHDLAVRMLADRFDLAGWDPLLLGADMPAYDIARGVVDFSADLLALSAAMTLHVRATHEVVEAVRRATPGSTPPILVGGLPFLVVPDLYAEVGADATAATLDDAVEVAEQLIAQPRAGT